MRDLHRPVTEWDEHRYALEKAPQGLPRALNELVGTSVGLRADQACLWSHETLIRSKLRPALADVDPGNQSGVNESPHPARLGRGLHHETNPSHTRADHPQAQNG